MTRDRYSCWVGMVSGVAVGLLLQMGVAFAADDERGERSSGVVKTEDGLRFRLPSDWPVEKRGAVVAPIPVEEYLSRKLSGLDARLRMLEQQLSSFDLRLRVLEEAVKGQGRLRSSSEPPQP